MIGNSCGGTLRCPHCTADFDNFQQLWSYAHLKTCRSKTLSSISNLLSVSSSGIVRESGIFSACENEEQRVKLLNLIKDVKLAVDPLHNLKGHMKNLLQSLKEWSCWNEAVFVKLLADNIQRKAVSDLDGSHMRYVASKCSE